jgi:hypothetical protein
MSLKAQQELVAAVAVRYQQATKSEEHRILDEFVPTTGYQHKYAINILRSYNLLRHYQLNRNGNQSIGPASWKRIWWLIVASMGAEVI